MKWKRTAMSLALAGCMMATTVPVTAFAANVPETTISGTSGEWSQKLTADDITLVTSDSYVSKSEAASGNYKVTVEAEIDLTKFPDQGKVQYAVTDEADLTTVQSGMWTTINQAANAKIGIAKVELNLKKDAVEKLVKEKTVTVTFRYVQDNDEVVTKSCEIKVGPDIAVTGVDYADTLNVHVGGESRKIYLDWTPANADIPSIAWKVANPAIAAVNQNGEVSAVAAGTTYVTGTYTVGGQTKTITVKVVVDDPRAGIQIEEQDELGSDQVSAGTSMYVGNTLVLRVKFNNMDDETDVTWTSSNPSVVKVEKGTRATATITAVSAGKATITANAGGKTVQYDVTVKATGNAAKDVNLDKNSVTLRQGVMWEADNLPALLNNQDAIVNLQLDPVTADAEVEVGKPIVNGTRINAISNDSIFVTPISSDSKMLFVSVGSNVQTGTYEVVIPVTVTNADDNVKAFEKEVKLTVNVEKIDPSSAQVLELTTENNSAVNSIMKANRNYLVKNVTDLKVYPTSLRDQVTYSIDDTSVAELVKTSAGYTIKTKKAGGFTLTAKVGDLTSSVSMAVVEDKAALAEIRLSESNVVLAEEATTTLEVQGKVNGNSVFTDVDLDNIIWSSSDPSVATVDGTGKVTALKAGTTNITATVGSYSATCRVVVGNADTDPKPTIKFTDVPEGAWYHDAVYAAANKGLMNGVGDNKFEPLKNVQRSQVATIIWNMKGAPATTGTTPFTDVPANAWYTQAVTWAYQNQVVAGTSKTTFSPNVDVTREDFLVMLYNEAGTPKAEATGDLSKFVDANEVDSWATDAVKWGVAKGILNGNEKKELNPTDTLTRAEAAAIMVNYVG